MIAPFAPPFWIADEMIGAATLAEAEAAGFRPLAMNHFLADPVDAPGVVCLDLLDHARLARIARVARAAWTAVAPLRGLMMVLPMFGTPGAPCPDCVRKRLTAMPPGGADPEVEHRFQRVAARRREEVRGAFTPMIARFAAAAARTRLEEAMAGARDVAAGCIALDQVGNAHISVRITPVHGCPTCRGAAHGGDRFAARLAHLFPE